MHISTLKKLDFFKYKNLLDLELFVNQGYCNNNYKLSTSNKPYLIREFNNNINRIFEFKIQKSAYHKNIAPQPFILNQDNSFMVTDFVDGIHKSKLTNIELVKLVQKVKKLHLIKIKMKEHNLKQDFVFYAQVLKDKDSKKLIKQSLTELFKLKRYKKDLVLTHHDLNPKNIIFTKNSIKIIDWEYAGVNDLFFDLATLCCEFKLSKEEERLLLKTYFKKTTTQHKDKLHSYKIIYKNLCLLWFKSLNKN